MENILVWILIFAGATIGLLATFLIASERELNAQRDESKGTSDNPTPQTRFISESATSADPLQAREGFEEVMRKNRELVREVTLLKDQLLSSETTAQRLEERLSGLERHKTELAESNQTLQGELEALKRQNQASSAKSHEVNPDPDEVDLQNRQLEYESEKLKSKHSRAGALEAELESLKKQLADSYEEETALENLRCELADQVQLNRDLKDDNYRLREQIFEMQRQLDITASDGERLILARQRLSIILANHEALANTAHEIQNTLVEFGALLINETSTQVSTHLPIHSANDELSAECSAEPIEITDTHQSAGSMEGSSDRTHNSKEVALP